MSREIRASLVVEMLALHRCFVGVLLGTRAATDLDIKAIERVCCSCSYDPPEEDEGWEHRDFVGAFAIAGEGQSAHLVIQNRIHAARRAFQDDCVPLANMFVGCERVKYSQFVGCFGQTVVAPDILLHARSTRLIAVAAVGSLQNARCVLESRSSPSNAIAVLAQPRISACKLPNLLFEITKP